MKSVVVEATSSGGQDRRSESRQMPLPEHQPSLLPPGGPQRGSDGRRGMGPRLPAQGLGITAFSLCNVIFQCQGLISPANRKHDKEHTAQAFPGCPPYGCICQCFWSLCRAKASAVGPTWSSLPVYTGGPGQPRPGLAWPAWPLQAQALSLPTAPPPLPSIAARAPLYHADITPENAGLANPLTSTFTF